MPDEIIWAIEGPDESFVKAQTRIKSLLKICQDHIFKNNSKNKTTVFFFKLAKRFFYIPSCLHVFCIENLYLAA